MDALMATEGQEGVSTQELDPATLGTEHNYTSTYVGADSLGELLRD